MHIQDDRWVCQGLNAIAHGIETRLDSLLGQLKLMTQKTIKAARNIGIPESAIRHW